MDKNKRVAGYMLFGLGFFILWFLFKLGGIPNIGKALVSTTVDVLLSMISMAFTVEVLLTSFIYKQRYGTFSAAFVALILVTGTALILAQLAIMDTSLFAYRRNIAKYQEHYFYWFWSDLIFGSYFLVTFLCLTGMAIRMAIDRISSERRLHMAEIEMVASELQGLKHQINPHFIFNTLNTIYYKIDKTNAPARMALDQFSSLLRYLLYESNGPTVCIEKELGFLRNYIEVQQQRLNPGCFVEVCGFEDLHGFDIPANLLLPIVENCFKHLAEPAGGHAFVRIQATHKAGSFSFQTENSAQNPPKPEGKGIGIDNVRRRLDLLYKDKYSYEVIPGQNKFSTSLCIAIT